ALSPVDVLPKKSGAYANSSSIPVTPFVLPIDTPQFRRFSSQLVRLTQFAESPPNPKPTKGVMKPWAHTDRGAKLNSAIERTRTRCKDITTSYRRGSAL